MRASNWRSDIFFVIELGVDISHYSTTKKHFGFLWFWQDSGSKFTFTLGESIARAGSTGSRSLF